MTDLPLAAASPPPLTGLTTGLLAFAAGAAVANSYYNQAILDPIASGFGLAGAAVTAIPVVTQLGNGLGVLFIAPLGDRLERRRLILVTTAALVAALLAAAAAPAFLPLVFASFAVGLFATVAQQIVPLAMHLAAPESRGRTLGTVTGGILAGILLARAMSGTISGLWGWQATFLVAAALMSVVGLALAARLPAVPPTTSIGYGALLASLAALLRRHPELRRATLMQCFVFAALIAFWANVSLLLRDPPFGFGPAAVGLLALVGAGGVLAAPAAGRMVDRRGHDSVVRGAILLMIAAFALLAAVPGSIAALAIAALMLDIGVQAAQVANQTRIHALDPTARSRLNTVFMAAMLFAGAAGAGLGGLAFAHAGWGGTVGFGMASATSAVAIALLPQRGRAKTDRS